MNTLYLDTDPMEHYTHVSHEDIVASLGLIPDILGNAVASGSESFRSALESSYGFPLRDMIGGTVDNGIYKYPQDPDLYPICSYIMKCKDKPTVSILQYRYGIMHIDEGNTSYTVRMD